MKSNEKVVRAFYEMCLSVNAQTDLNVMLNTLLADDFQSLNAAGKKTKTELINQINGFWKLMPDMKWEIQELIQQGDKVVVRSVFSASPQGNFMGLELDGRKSFKTMAIDIHTISDGQIQSVYHCEEWATAMAQLKS